VSRGHDIRPIGPLVEMPSMELPFATVALGSRLCKNVWRFFQIAQKGQKTPTWFGAAKIRYANFSELIYSEMQFGFYTASVVTSR
jgi:hypothetical protein